MFKKFFTLFCAVVLVIVLFAWKSDAQVDGFGGLEKTLYPIVAVLCIVAPVVVHLIEVNKQRKLGNRE